MTTTRVRQLTRRGLPKKEGGDWMKLPSLINMGFVSQMAVSEVSGIGEVKEVRR